MDKFINFNNNNDDNNSSLKLNMDELFAKKQQQDLNVLNNYNKILTRIHSKIKHISKQLVNDECCWYIVPEFIIGIPKYDNKECIAFIIDKLRDNGFIVRYTHPNLLFISWKQWIPTYVRNEIKKKTGKIVDEYGNLKEANNNNNNNNNVDIDDNNLDILNIAGSSSNNILDKKINLNKNNSNSRSNSNFKDINSYKPSGLIYSENLLKKLNI